MIKIVKKTLIKKEHNSYPYWYFELDDKIMFFPKMDQFIKMIEEVMIHEAGVDVTRNRTPRQYPLFKQKILKLFETIDGLNMINFKNDNTRT